MAKKSKEKQPDAYDHAESEKSRRPAAAAEGASDGTETESDDTREQDGGDSAGKSEEIENKVAELNERYLRAKAEFDNYRKRMQREVAETREYAKAMTVQEFFSVFDHFQMAMDHVEQTPDFDTLKQGMEMILGEFRRTFEALGVKEIDAEGEPFDPNEHEAVAQEPSDDVPKDTVIRQWKRGYRMGDRLLRPASVVVSSGSPDHNVTESES